MHLYTMHEMFIRCRLLVVVFLMVVFLMVVVSCIIPAAAAVVVEHQHYKLIPGQKISWSLDILDLGPLGYLTCALQCTQLDCKHAYMESGSCNALMTGSFESSDGASSTLLLRVSHTETCKRINENHKIRAHDARIMHSMTLNSCWELCLAFESPVCKSIEHIPDILCVLSQAMTTDPGSDILYHPLKNLYERCAPV